MEGRRSWVFRVRLASPFLYWGGVCGVRSNLTDAAIAEEGIVGRGVLLDFHSWRLAQDPPINYDPFKGDSIPLRYLKATAEAQGTEIKFGDILMIRSGTWSSFRCRRNVDIDKQTGFLAAQNDKGEDELSEVKNSLPHTFAGVEQSEEMLRWIWENFSAVSGDQPSFERWRKSSVPII
jgi:hypothetical protein